jgi:endoglucanase
MHNSFKTKSSRLVTHGAVALLAAALSLIAPAARSQGAGYWHTSGNQIIDSTGQVVRLTGVNWYGFETPDFLAHGLWAQDYKTILNAIKSNGYNVIRIPFSNEMVESNPVPTNFTRFANGAAANTALVGQTALADLDILIVYAGSIGLRVISGQSPLGSRKQQ